MKENIKKIAGNILVHIALVLVLGGLAMFVWNMGVESLLPNHFRDIDYETALAMMTGIYLLDMFVKSYINKIISYKQSKLIYESIYGKEDKSEYDED